MAKSFWDEEDFQQVNNSSFWDEQDFINTNRVAPQTVSTPIGTSNSSPIYPQVEQSPVVAQPTGFVPKGTGFNLLNPVVDLYNAGKNLKENAPMMAKEFAKSVYDNASGNGLANTLPALGRGIVSGAVDLFPMIAGLGVDTINSIADKEVINMPRERRQPMATTFEAWRNLQDTSNSLATPVVEGQDVSQYKKANPVMEYISGNNGGAESARFAEGLGTFLVPMGAVNKGVNAVRASQMPTKVAKESARIASKLDDAQKLKYGKYVDQLAQKKVLEKMNSPMRKFADDVAFGGALDMLEGENLQERFENVGGGALMGGAMHVGMKGAGKAYKKVEPKVNEIVKNASEMPWASTAIAYTDNMLNTNLSKKADKLTQLKKQYLDLTSKDESLERNLTDEEMKILEDAQSLTPEQQEELFSRIKKGNKKHAWDQVEKQTREVNENTSAEDVANVYNNIIEKTNDRYASTTPVSEVSNPVDINTPKLEGTAVKTHELPASVNPKKSRKEKIARQQEIIEQQGGVKAMESDVSDANTTSSVAENVYEPAEHSKALQDLLDDGFLDEIIDPVSMKKKVAPRLNEVKEQTRYTGAEPIDNYKKTVLKPGMAEGADYLQTSKYGKGNEDIYANVITDSSVNRADFLSESGSKKLNKLKQVLDVKENPHTNRLILVDKSTGKPIHNDQIIALRKKFGKDLDAFEMELRKQYDERTHKEGIKQELREEAEFDNEPINESDFDYSGEEGVNSNYIKEGFSKNDSIGDLTNTRTRGKEVTFEDRVSESKFQKFWKEFNDDNNNHQNRNAILNEYLMSVEPEQRGKIVQRVSEELLKEAEAYAPKKIGDDSATYQSAQEKSVGGLKSITDTTKDMDLKEQTGNIDPTEVAKGESALRQVLFKLSKRGMDGTNQKAIFAMLKRGDNATIAKSLMQRNPDKAQGYYDAIYEHIAKAKISDNAKKSAIKSINNLVRDMDNVKTKDYYSMLQSTAKRNAIEQLGEAIKNNDISSIVKTFRKFKHSLHKTFGLTQRETDIINEAYGLEGKNTLNKILNIEDTVKAERDKVVAKANKGGYKPEPEIFTRARVVRELKAEYEKMQNIIDNSYTDRSLSEGTKWVEGEGGSDSGFKFTGDAKRRDISDVRQVELEKVRRQVEKIFDLEQDAEIINRFYKDGSLETTKGVDVEMQKNLDNAKKQLADLKAQIPATKQLPLFKRKPALDKLMSKIDDAQKNIKKLESDIEATKLTTESIATEKGYDFDAMFDYMNKLDKGARYLDPKLVKKYARWQGASEAWVNRALSAIDKVKKGDKTITESEIKAFNEAMELMKEWELPTLKEAKGGAKYYKESKDARQAHAIAKHIAEGKSTLGDMRNVKPGQQGEFFKGLSKALGDKLGNSKQAVATFIDTLKKFSTIKEYDDFGNAYYKYGQIPDRFKQSFDKMGWSDKVRTTFDFKDLYKILPISDESANLLGKIIHGVDDSSILVTDKLDKQSMGKTSVNGAMSSIVVEGRTPSEILRTSIHELTHKFLRQNRNNEKVLAEFGLTKEDLNHNETVTDLRQQWSKGEGKPLFDYLEEHDAVSLDAPEHIKKLNLQWQIKKAQWAINKEEKVCNDIADKILEEVSDDRFRKTTENKKDSSEISRDVGTTDSRIAGESEISDVGHIRSKRGSVDGSNGRESNNISSSNGTAEGTKFLDDLNNDFLKKEYNEFKNADGKIKGIYDLLEHNDTNMEKFLLDITAFPEEQLKNRKIKQDIWGEGIYFQQGGKPLGRIKWGEQENTKLGYTGEKKFDGIEQRGTSAQTVARSMYRDVRRATVANRLSFLDKHFSKAPEGFYEGLADDYVQVNRNLLANAMFWGKSKAWYETMVKGEKAIKETFKNPEEAKKWIEASKLCKDDGRSLFLPKSMLEMSITGADDLPIDYLKQYGQKVGSRGYIKGLGKIAGAMLDYNNDRFKRMVLTSMAFFTNNRFGNQIMLMAHAKNPAEYFRGIKDAITLKDTDIPPEILESTLADAVWHETGGNNGKGGLKALKQKFQDNYEGQNSTKRYFSQNRNNPFDNLVRLLDGVAIYDKDLPLGKKLATKAVNWAFAVPNTLFKQISSSLMELNAKAERFERKQAYSQGLNRVQMDRVLKTARKMTTVKHLIEEIKSDSILRQTVIDKVADVLGDYNNFNKFEKNFMKRIIPFYAWNRTILRHSIALCKDNPTKLALIALKTLELHTQDDGLEDYQHGALKTGIYDKTAGKNLVINKTKMIPYATLFDMASGESIGSISPGIKKPIEAVQGEKWFKPSSEIQNKRYKRMSHKGQKGYLDTKTGEFKEGGLPAGARLAYVGKDALETVYPHIGSPLTKGVNLDVIEHHNKTGEWRLPDKQYDASLGGFYDGDYIGSYNGKAKKRSAKMKMDLGHQVANRLTGLGLQPEQRKAQKEKWQKQSRKLRGY